MAKLARRLFVASIAGAFALIVGFAIIFYGFLFWVSQDSPHDGQAGMSALLLGIIVAPPIAVVTFLAFAWSRQRGKN